MSIMDEIIAPSAKGQDEKGRFVKGHKLAKGNPLVKHVQRNKSDWLNQVRPGHVRTVYRSLLKRAAKGDVSAITAYLNWTIGKPTDETSQDDRSKIVQLFLTHMAKGESPKRIVQMIDVQAREPSQHDEAESTKGMHADSAQPGTSEQP